MMHDKAQHYDLDAQWFINKCHARGIKTNEDLIDNFCERVAIQISEGMNERDARESVFLALTEV